MAFFVINGLFSALFVVMFPKCPEVRHSWIKAIRRKNWKPTKYSRLCSRHFDKSCFVTGLKLRKLKSDAVPFIFEGYPKYYQPDSIIKLKDSTRKLLYLLEEIQTKTHSNIVIPDDIPNLTDKIKPIQSMCIPTTVSEVIGAGALKKLENQAKTLDAIYIENEDDDCSVFKRLTRKCVCLNQQEYNDFIIHFNEDTKYFTSTVGEIIKNMRILKKFVYMAGSYSKNALMFLNETKKKSYLHIDGENLFTGLADSTHSEKVAIIQGVAYADMCNVFDEYSIVVVCISWPCKYENYGDRVSQNLTAALINKIAQVEEGRRYLNFTSKITNDIKKTLRKKSASLDFDTLELLNDTLNLMHPPMSQNVNVTYYCRPMDEGFANKTVKGLLHHRQYMTLDEVFVHLDLIHNLSQAERNKNDLTLHLPALLVLFKHMLMEYDNSEMNVVITNILNNIVTKSLLQENEPQLPATMVVADTGTEPIKTKNGSNQIPPAKRTNHAKNKNKSKSLLGVTSTYRQASRRKVTEWESPRAISRSKKFTKKKDSVIVVPA